jgi:TonB family protein
MSRMTPYWKLLVALLGLAAEAGASGQAPAAPAMKQPAVLDFRSCAKPQYPHAELAAKHQGTVTLLFQVDAEGKVTDSRIGASSGFPALDESARSALAQCRFQPASAADGQPLAVWTKIQYVWTTK